MQERKTNHILMYLAYEQMVFGVIQLQRKNWVTQTKRECCTRASQPVKALCKKVRQLPIEDICIRVRQMQLRVSHLPLEYPRGVHLHLIYVYTCENPLFNGGIYFPSLNIFYPISS